ncbi:potassium efflux system protein [Pseudomonas duriflava]|uniref:Potassium efflux system protein n=1 Tax=Pseudomonas duriflava TaxID=459528 RepID=A0A562QBS4_9PSED|nr:mechanosensitive channel MscK [Pseudomonas duriflava]TWI54188.1 potassium efflux system protein [Pseudomonas duriflava]
MSALRPLLSFLLLSLCFCTSLAQAQETSSTLPDAKQVQQNLDSLADRKLPATDQQVLQDMLKQTLQLLDQKAQHEQNLNALKKTLAQAPQLIKDAQRDLAKLREEPDKPIAQRYGNLSPRELENLQSQRSVQLNDWQNALNDANTLVITSQTRPERAQLEIGDAQARLQTISDTLKAGRENGKPILPERRNQLLAEQAERNALIQLRQQELSANSTLQDLGSIQRELYTERVKRMEQESLDLQALISGKRRQQSEETFAALSRESQQAANANDVLAQESKLNLTLSDYLLRATDRLNDLTRRSLETKQQLDQLRQTSETLDQQINVLRGSLLLSKLLYQQRASLPTVEVSKNLTDDIADLRLYQFELNQQRAQVANLTGYIDNLLAQQPPEQVTPELRKQLLELVKTRIELQDRLSTELSALLSESISLQLSQKQLIKTSESLRATLDEQMFWIPSNRPLDWSWLKDAPKHLLGQVTLVPWLDSLKALSAGLVDHLLIFLPLVVAIATLLWRRHYLYEKLNTLNKDIGHFQRDSQLHTPLAIVLTVLLAMPVSLTLALIGVGLESDKRGLNGAIGAALMEMAVGWLIFYTVYRLLESGGVAETHFRWARTQVDSLRRLVRRLGILALALMAVVAIAERQLNGLAGDVIGILIVLVCYAGMAWMLGRSLLNAAARERLPLIRLLLGLMITAIPAGLFLAVCLGYYYTSLKLTDRLIDTLYLLLAWIIMEAALARGLNVAARRLAYHRALTRRQNQQEAAELGETLEEEPALDMEQVNQQSLRLIRLALWLGFLGVLYWVWADVVAVFSYLDNITLYENTRGSGETATVVPVTLRDFLSAIFIAGLTFALARNLPGLLEVLVLSRLQLAQGTAYAVTTLLSHAIITIGVISALSTLGVSWDKLQWLAAALSVGLGFGLQEIFGNFISGLIILFERPVRIGDLITIGNVTGTVKRIQIRATHIVDADNKSVVVPNKTFVTSQLINWTLTDTMTRVTLLIGVGYGSDLEKVRALLFQAAYDNPRVLRDPEPMVLFQAFGESTLNHELRVHVRELGDRAFATDEINRRIEQLFRENDIEIAFRQLEVSVKKMDGIEQLLNRIQIPIAGNSGVSPDSGQKA